MAIIDPLLLFHKFIGYNVRSKVYPSKIKREISVESYLISTGSFDYYETRIFPGILELQVPLVIQSSRCPCWTGQAGLGLVLDKKLRLEGGKFEEAHVMS